MSTLNYLAGKISDLKNRRTRKNNNPPPTNELAHPRFGIEAGTTEEGKAAEKKAPNSLLFLMYSKENETLFI